MLYNHDFLMLHYPKTAGKSVALYFCQNFEKPIHGRVSRGQLREIGMGPDDGVHLAPEGGHDNFITARRIMKEQDVNLMSMRAFLAPVRNPYDLMLSNYYFLRSSFEKNKAVRTRPSFLLAANTTFPEFCARVEMADFANFLPPERLRTKLPTELIRFENLAESLSNILAKYGIEEKYPLQHLNASKRPRDYASMYDEDTKAHVDAKMASMFRIGGYPTEL